jgi:hypothetical protein
MARRYSPAKPRATDAVKGSPVKIHIFVSFSLVSALFAGLGWVPPSAAGQNVEIPPPLVSPAPGEGTPNLNGIWTGPDILFEEAVRRALGGELPPFTPYGLERWENKDLTQDPGGFCQPRATVRVFHSPMYFQIIQTEGLVTFLFELEHQYHRVFTDGRDHPEPLDITWWGSSIGRYEGNRFVVETIGLDDRSWLFTAGLQHSEQLRFTQIFEKTGLDTIAYTETYEDPVFFTEPWSISFDLDRQEFDMLEVICEDNNRDPYHYGSGNRELAP